ESSLVNHLRILSLAFVALLSSCSTGSGVAPRTIKLTTADTAIVIEATDAGPGLLISGPSLGSLITSLITEANVNGVQVPIKWRFVESASSGDTPRTVTLKY